MSIYNLFFCLVCCLFFAGCAAPIARNQNIEPFPFPDQHQVDEIPQRWWTLFHETALNDLVSQALAHSPQIHQIKYKLLQAQAVAGVSYADLLPELSVSGDYQKTQGQSTRDGFVLSGATSYELDLWGKNRATWQGNLLEAKASVEDLRAAAITLSARVVENYLRLLSLRQSKALVQSQIKTNTLILQLQEKRYASGSASALDVLQQKEILSGSRTKLPDIQANEALILQELATLTGQYMLLPQTITVTDFPEIPVLPDVGVSSRLLNERPDLQAAWMRVRAADWFHAQARRNRLPAFRLSARYSSNRDVLSAVLDQWLLGFVADLTLPVFDAGKRRAQSQQQKALADAAYQTYRKLVLDAVSEVQSALVQNTYQQKKLTELKQQLDVASAVLKQAEISYASGEVGYINVLNARIRSQALALSWVQARLDLALYRVALFRSLGLKNWTDSLLSDMSDE